MIVVATVTYLYNIRINFLQLKLNCAIVVYKTKILFYFLSEKYLMFFTKKNTKFKELNSTAMEICF